MNGDGVGGTPEAGAAPGVGGMHGGAVSGSAPSGGVSIGGTGFAGEASGGSLFAGAPSGGALQGGSGGAAEAGAAQRGGEGGVGGGVEEPTVIAIVAGAYHTCALRADGAIKCWGANGNGELGVGDTAHRGDEPNELGAALPNVDLGVGRKALSIAAGNTHTCAVLDGGDVKCWGNGTFGALGLGDTNDRGDAPGEMGDALPTVDLGTGKKALAVAPGAAHTCALLQGGTVKCWGNNDGGQLGLGDVRSRGDDLNEMGDALPEVDLGSGRTAVSISAGQFHTCALLDDHSVRCWGENTGGALGLGDLNRRGDAPGEMGDALPVVALGSDRTPIALEAGAFNNCALLSAGKLLCWGQNNEGQLGQGDQQSRGDNAGEMGDALATVDLGTDEAVVSVSSYFASCAVFSSGSMKCFGYNFDGELGLGDIKTRGDDPGEMGAALPFVKVGAGRTVHAVANGPFHTCAVLDDSSVRCWGYNSYGQLGRGNQDDIFGVNEAEPPVPLW
ncbi:MAG TPA: hypothetical protein VHB79_36110 [Polyangiaceae bacterium]|nr:hypothetical protein [Polyangiaceae bacterium]